MTRPISDMTAAQIDREFQNFERHRLSGDARKRQAFAANRARYEALLEARDGARGFRRDVSRGVIGHAAAGRRFVCYKDIADANGVGWTVAHRTLPGHLWDLVCDSHDLWGFMISAVIVNKEHVADGGMEPPTLKGFVEAARRLGFAVTEPERFLREQQAQVFAHFAA